MLREKRNENVKNLEAVRVVDEVEVDGMGAGVAAKSRGDNEAGDITRERLAGTKSSRVLSPRERTDQSGSGRRSRGRSGKRWTGRAA